MTQVLSNVSREEVEAMRDILQRLTGTDIGPGDGITVEVRRHRNEFSQQDGNYIVAVFAT